MSKPLELTIYPPAECTCTAIPDFLGAPAGRPQRMALSVDCGVHLNWHEAKRLSDAELAAEYHQLNYERVLDRYDLAPAFRQPMVAIMKRFATHPHYFEATEPESDTE